MRRFSDSLINFLADHEGLSPEEIVIAKKFIAEIKKRRIAKMDEYTQIEKRDDEYAYIGTKIVLAFPRDEFTFLKVIKDQKAPPNQENREGYQVQYEDGYVSWSPKETFERAYRRITDAERRMV